MIDKNGDKFGKVFFLIFFIQSFVYFINGSNIATNQKGLLAKPYGLAALDSIISKR